MRTLIFILSLTTAVYSQTPPIEPGVSQDLARWRAARYSGVRYNLDITLEKMSPVLKGTMEIRVVTGGQASPIILDWRKIRGFEDRSTISNISINGSSVQSASFSSLGAGEERDKSRPLNYQESNEHLIFRDGVVVGENVIKLDFTSPILPSGSAITRYVDKEDGSEYIYSLFVPSDASTAFPVFDQPDLKAKFTLSALAPKSWKLVSNSNIGVSVVGDRICELPLSTRRLSDLFSLSSIQPNPTPSPASVPSQTFSSEQCEMSDIWTSDETKPISTYVFAFAAGPFEQVSEPGAVATGSPGETETTKGNPVATAQRSDRSRHIFVRKSQLAKFKPHAAEVFRLNREAVKYFEEYFDYKFPFPKYDLVLIPEFPFGGMEHAGATFLREASIIFPQEPTKNDLASRATLIFHETAHQWFGDTVTMRWFDDLWLKEGFATFMAYKAMEKIMPEMNSWKIFYERIKQGAYQTDSTRGTTAIYQPITNLSAAKSAYGNIVYNKAPAFLRQAEFYLGEDKFQTAVRAFLKKHEFGNAGWEDLVKEFETANSQNTNDQRRNVKEFSDFWVRQPGLIRFGVDGLRAAGSHGASFVMNSTPTGEIKPSDANIMGFKVLYAWEDGTRQAYFETVNSRYGERRLRDADKKPALIFPNYQDYGYGIFLLDDKSRDYVLRNIQNEKDPFLRSMMWGALWDSIREGELDPRAYVELALKNLSTEPDESITASVLSRVTTAVNYYLNDEAKLAVTRTLEDLLEREMLNADSLGRRITYYRSFLNIGTSIRGREVYKKILLRKFWPKPQAMGGLIFSESKEIPIKTKDKFDIVTRLLILGDPEAVRLLAELEKTEKGDDAKRYAYAARAGIGKAENKSKYWNDFSTNKEISESWIEAAFGPFNSIRHAELTLPYLQKALQELPNHKRNRKIFFVNGWLGAFIGGQRSEEALAIVNKFLADNPSLDRDLRLKILENVDVIERAVKIRKTFGG